MKVHLIKKQSIEEFVINNSQGRAAFNTWLSILNHADWELPQDIITTFKTADILGNGSDRVVFNIGGNKYRMICKYHFGNNKLHLFVKWIGTHAEYSKICNDGNQYDVNCF
jgi:mRNA interferase HigB